jgi:hypothetical protein
MKKILKSCGMFLKGFYDVLVLNKHIIELG